MDTNQIVIEIDPKSGFCFGVVNAIQKAEEELSRDTKLYCLGDIVHNSREVNRLAAIGMETINHDQFHQLNQAVVLLRAHGEPPPTYQYARENNITIVDATCPVVLQLQKKIKKMYTSGCDNLQIVIYGKRGHAEVNGLVGQTDGEAIVIESVNEMEWLDFSKNIRLYAQTTQSVDGFVELVEEIRGRMLPGTSFESFDTICRQVANRLPNIRQFAAEHDLILFVSGKKSSNGKVLYEACRLINNNTHLIQDASEFETAWLTGISSIGICGATSTPKWLMEEVRNHIYSILSKNV